MSEFLERLAVERLEAPIPQGRVEEFFAFWRGFFDPSDEDFRSGYTGGELEHNRDIVYLARPAAWATSGSWESGDSSRIARTPDPIRRAFSTKGRRIRL